MKPTIEQLLNETKQKQKEISNLLRKIDDRDKELEQAYEVIRDLRQTVAEVSDPSWYKP